MKLTLRKLLRNFTKISQENAGGQDSDLGQSESSVNSFTNFKVRLPCIRLLQVYLTPAQFRGLFIKITISIIS